MSLITDIIFVRALRSNSELMAALPAGDVYNTTIALPDEEVLNAPVPYVIVTYDGMQNDSQTKDDSYEGDTDNVQIGIEIAAKTRKQLGELATQIRETVSYFFENLTGDDPDFDLVPLNYNLTAQGVNYDSDKPCYWQILNYQCDTNV
jgi:hypothetical protein